MSPIHQALIHDELVERRQRLEEAIVTLPQADQLRELMSEVDLVLSRLDTGTYGLCDTCGDPVEPEQLAGDPLLRHCLDHLTPRERRALEQDLQLTWRIQSTLLPERELRVGAWEATSHYEPAGPASGDCCDVVPLDDGELFIGYFAHDRIIDVDVLVGAFMMIRRSALEQVGGMDEQYFMYCEEVDWCKRFVEAGWKIRFFPETKVIHYGGGSSASEPVRFFKEFCLSNLRYWNKHHARPLVISYRLVMILRYLIRLPFWSILSSVRKDSAMKTKLQSVISGVKIFLSANQNKSLDVQF